jgi:DNA-binding MarR family transcriptional regulator
VLGITCDAVCHAGQVEMVLMQTPALGAVAVPHPIRYARYMGSNTMRRHTHPPVARTRQVLDAIRRIVQALRESSRLAESRVGLSGAQLFVLRTVVESPGLSLNELAERTRTHQSSVSAIVTRLAREGLVEKRTADGDGRRVEIRLSPSGRRRLDRAPQAAQERLVASVDALPAAERARLAATLEGLVQRMALGRKRPAMFFEEPAPRVNARRRARA